MYIEIFDLIYTLFYGSTLPSDLTQIQLFVPEFLSYVCCSVVVIIPIAFVYFMFKWLTRLIQWEV